PFVEDQPRDERRSPVVAPAFLLPSLERPYVRRQRLSQIPAVLNELILDDLLFVVVDKLAIHRVEIGADAHGRRDRAHRHVLSNSTRLCRRRSAVSQFMAIGTPGQGRPRKTGRKKNAEAKCQVETGAPANQIFERSSIPRPGSRNLLARYLERTSFASAR